jgi:hypothetical protein
MFTVRIDEHGCYKHPIRLFGFQRSAIIGRQLLVMLTIMAANTKPKTTRQTTTSKGQANEAASINSGNEPQIRYAPMASVAPRAGSENLLTGQY